MLTVSLLQIFFRPFCSKEPAKNGALIKHIIIIFPLVVYRWSHFCLVCFILHTFFRLFCLSLVLLFDCKHKTKSALGKVNGHHAIQCHAYNCMLQQSENKHAHEQFKVKSFVLNRPSRLKSGTSSCRSPSETSSS